jgi:hypothetical protein
MSNVNSIRPVGGARLRPLCEAHPVAHASAEVFRSERAGQQDSDRVLKESVNERKATEPPTGGWRQNGRKRERGKQGDLPRIRTVFMAQWPEEPPGRSQSVRSSREARNERGAKGRRKVEA